MTTATVAALLTILGYSLYDTIIVFDRVRENVPRMPRAAFSQIVNRSMSEVLTRSLATSFCTLLPVLALLFFGGETLKDFAFALMVGIASGAYSSIFIASPVLTHWKEREGGYRNRRARIVRELGQVPAYATTAGARRRTWSPRRSANARGAEASSPPRSRASRSQGKSSRNWCATSTSRGASRPRSGPAEIGRRRRGAAGAGGGARDRTPRSSAIRRRTSTPEDLVLKDEPKPREKRRRPRNRRHGRSR